METFEREEVFSSPGVMINEMGITKGGSYLLLILGQRDVMILDKKSFKKVGSFKLENYEETISNISTLSNERKYIVADSMGRIMIYDLDENKYVEVIEATREKRTYRTMTLSKDSKYFAYTDDS